MFKLLDKLTLIHKTVRQVIRRIDFRSLNQKLFNVTMQLIKFANIHVSILIDFFFHLFLLSLPLSQFFKTPSLWIFPVFTVLWSNWIVLKWLNIGHLAYHVLLWIIEADHCIELILIVDLTSSLFYCFIFLVEANIFVAKCDMSIQCKCLFFWWLLIDILR